MGGEAELMLVQINVMADESDKFAANSFYRWLLRDRELNRSGAVSLADESRPGEMGSLDVINVLLTQGTGLLSLALSYATWRDSRPKPPSVKITVGVRSVVLSGEPPEVFKSKVQTLLEDETPADEQRRSQHISAQDKGTTGS